MMRFLRLLLCKMDIRHRPAERWMPLGEAKVSVDQARIWGCTVREGRVNFFKCVDCESVIAPFEMQSRGWAPYRG